MITATAKFSHLAQTTITSKYLAYGLSQWKYTRSGLHTGSNIYISQLIVPASNTLD